MRFHFTFELENEVIDVNYRRKILSFLKNAIEKSDKQFYHELYGNGSNINKDFTMSVYFVPETQYGTETISVKSKRVIVNMSTPDSLTGIQLYNAMCGQKFIKYRFSGENSLRLVKIQNEKEKLITQNRAVFNTMSPIVIRDHNRETGRDWFYTFEDEPAVDILKRNLEAELSGKFQRDIGYDIRQLKIEFIRMKKVIIKNYELKIPCSLGIFSMEGDQYLLQYLYQRGVGAKRSLCFGMLDLI